MSPRTAIFCGALLAALGVTAGAIGAHVIENRLSLRQLDNYETAVRYQLFHAVGLVLVGLLAMQRRSPCLAMCGWSLLLGVLLFSGGLVGYVASTVTPLPLKFLRHVVPVGGVLLIVGWLLMAVHAWRNA